MAANKLTSDAFGSRQEIEMTTRKLTIGDSTIGYDTALVTTTKSGKYRLVSGSIVGRAWHIKKAIAALNRDYSGYITKAGDEKSIYLASAK